VFLQTGIAREEMATFPDIDECSVVYFPQLGYLLATPREDPSLPPPHIPGLEFQVPCLAYPVIRSNWALILATVTVHNSQRGTFQECTNAWYGRTKPLKRNMIVRV
jgi:hypothetical protein